MELLLVEADTLELDAAVGADDVEARDVGRGELAEDAPAGIAEQRKGQAELRGKGFELVGSLLSGGREDDKAA